MQEGVISFTEEEANAILAEHRAVYKFVQFALILAAVKNPAKTMARRPRIVDSYQIARGTFGIYADSKGKQVTITPGMNLDEMTPITDKVLQEKGDMVQYRSFYRTAPVFNELLLETRIPDTLGTVPA